MLDKEKIALFLKAVDIFSPSGKEDEMGDFLLNFLKNKGFENVRKDDIGNVIGEIGGGEPTILLSSHMDTVDSHLPVKDENDKIYGRGTVDAKGPLMSLAIASSKFCKKDINGKIIFAGIVREEISTKGMDTLLDSGININYAIFAEPNNTINIVVAYKGRLSLKIIIKSNKGSGHPANSWLFDNSIELAFQFFNRIKDLFLNDYKGRTPYFTVIPNITEISSAEGKNVIPAKTEMYIDIRFPPGIISKKILEEIDDLKSDFMEENDCSINTEILSQVEGYSVSTKNELVESLKKAVQNTLGVKAKLTRKTGTTFMNIIGNKLDVPTVSIGPGDPKLEHTNNEYILKEDFLNEIKIIENFIETFLGFKDGN
ncbi:MAG: M20/M25/M40 family metallo-hydrolase [Candidatus Lokiarchaeota archaeon]|nr:M20/M25/M40 family metallo-hydrolase [Candidatus Lokiarchaeota archaeon]